MRWITAIILAAIAMAAAPAWASPREERVLAQSCEQGDRSACIALGKRLAEPGSLRQDRPRALALLRPACDSAASVWEAADICATVGELLLAQSMLDPASRDAALIDAYLARACDNGSRAACSVLVAELEAGEIIAADFERARRLHERLCRSGEQASCDALAEARVVAEAEAEAQAAATSAEGGTTGQDTEIVNADQNAPEAPEESSGTIVKDGEVNQPRPVRVTRGRLVTRGSANWMAMIWRPRRSGETDIPIAGRMACGASVIEPGWVLTAAHCLDDVIGRVTPRSGHSIRVGAYDSFDESEGLGFPILGIFPHPQYERKSLAWDIALIRYAGRPRQRGSVPGAIEPVALDTMGLQQRQIPGSRRATVLGWGRISSDPDQPNPSRMLRFGVVSLMDLPACRKALPWRDEDRMDTVLCARPRLGQHNCSGDSGGPLVLDDGAFRERVLIGVVSGGKFCGDGNRASRFVRVTHHSVRDWLQATLPGDVWRRIVARSR